MASHVLSGFIPVQMVSRSLGNGYFRVLLTVILEIVMILI
ncbi:unnamed protein product [Acidithrix sp. C25]|nr:unnamed protein product [Acidithrix sp. C25]